MYDFPIRSGCTAAVCTGFGGAGHALIRSGSKLLLFLVVFPLFSRKGLLLSMGLSLPSSIALRAPYPAVVISAEILGSWSIQGLCWTVAMFCACGRGDACHSVCTTDVFIAFMLRTFSPPTVESKELECERMSFSGTAGAEGPKWRTAGLHVRLFRSQKYMKIASATRMTPTGIIASPAIDADERPCLDGDGSETDGGIVGLPFVDTVSGGIVNCCSVDIVACCMPTVCKGSNHGVGSGVCWNRATRDGPSCVDVCDADRPSICTRSSIELYPFIAWIVAPRHLSTGAPPTIGEAGPLQSLCIAVRSEQRCSLASTKMR